MKEPLLSRSTLNTVAFPVAIAMAVFQCWFTSGFTYISNSVLTLIFLGFAMVLTFLTVPMIKPKEGKEEPKILLLIEIVLAVAAAVIISYFALIYCLKEDLPIRMNFRRRPSVSA